MGKFALKSQNASFRFDADLIIRRQTTISPNSYYKQRLSLNKNVDCQGRSKKFYLKFKIFIST
jgi:hypothetical protein